VQLFLFIEPSTRNVSHAHQCAGNFFHTVPIALRNASDHDLHLCSHSVNFDETAFNARIVYLREDDPNVGLTFSLEAKIVDTTEHKLKLYVSYSEAGRLQTLSTV
jgi:hypothetical protein